MRVNFNSTNLIAASSANVPPMLVDGQLLSKTFILQALRKPNFSLNAFSQVRCRHGTKDGAKKLSSVKPVLALGVQHNIHRQTEMATCSCVYQGCGGASTAKARGRIAQRIRKASAELEAAQGRKWQSKVRSRTQPSPGPTQSCFT